MYGLEATRSKLRQGLALGGGRKMQGPSHNQLVDYSRLLAQATDLQVVKELLLEELPYLWRDAYLSMTPRLTRIDRIRLGTFEYFYDDLATLEALGEVPYSPTAEARLMGVMGFSSPDPRARGREDRRLRGFIGPTQKEFGDEWDKGHFIAHEIGGSVTGIEVNVFIQLRALNRGWSDEGKIYRKMERYCRLNPGTFCFSRPIYDDETSKPSFVEFGVLRGANDLWVQIFDNRGPLDGARRLPKDSL